jgi:hypothetical protein
LGRSVGSCATNEQAKKAMPVTNIKDGVAAAATPQPSCKNTSPACEGRSGASNGRRYNPETALMYAKCQAGVTCHESTCANSRLCRRMATEQAWIDQAELAEAATVRTHGHQ